MSKKRVGYDIECYPNWFCINFKCFTTGKRRRFELYEGHPLDRTSIIRIMRKYCWISFNGNHYDSLMLRLAMRAGVTNKALKNLNDAIIVRQMMPWVAEQEFDLPKFPPYFDHIDIKEVAPSVKVGLKLYMGRLHSKRIQDLPYSPAEALTREQQVLTCDYCDNDIDGTQDLHDHVAPQIALREQMGKEYNLDLRSKSDAQMAEAVLKAELQRIKGEDLYKPKFPKGYTFKYEPPEFLTFKTQQMRDVFDTVCNATFEMKDKIKAKKTKEVIDGYVVEDVEIRVQLDKVEIPAAIKALKIQVGQTKYKLQIGGLHSQEKKATHYATEGTIIRDADVAAYYPSIVLVCGLYPEHLGPDFLAVYRRLHQRRVSAKVKLKAAKKLLEMGVKGIEAANAKADYESANVINMTLKIVLNGAFGKLGSKWSILFSPNLMIQVTMTGQLALLMLIERLELNKISVISANTDGIVAKFSAGQEDNYERIVKQWEKETGFELEFADYKALYSMSVNSYLAIKTNGEVKQKGLCAFVGSKGSPAEKNPSGQIVIDAVINYLKDGTPFRDTIEWCPDMRRFLSVRQVAGGGMYDGQYLGRVVRWFYGKNSVGPITYASAKKFGDKVAKTDGAVPMMELGPLAEGIDYQHYVGQAYLMLAALGVM